MRRGRSLVVVLALVLGLVGSTLWTPPTATAQVGGDWIDTADRAAVLAAYREVFEPEVPAAGWDGVVSSCTPGTLALGYRRALFDRIAFYRGMAGVESVVEDSGFSIDAQQAALLMAANGSLNRNPPETWRCFTEPGRNGAANSLLAIDRTGPRAIDGWVSDAAAANPGVGNRSWVLQPTQVRMGVGEVPGRTAALYVIDPENLDPPTPPGTREATGFVSWPPRGFVPSPVVYDRWSLHHRDADFSEATVSVRVAGQRVPAAIAYRGPGFGMPTFSFVPSVSYAGRTDRTVSVTVSNIVLEGQTTPVSHTWTTTVIPPPLTRDERFVVQAYRDFLGRDPSSGALGIWAAALATQAGARGALTSSLALSAEWVGALVDRFYNDTLGRDGDAAGLAFWTAEIRSRRLTPAAVAASFYASGEYFARFGQSDLTTWVNDLYDKLLGRVPDQAGVDHWVGVARDLGRRAVAGNFYQSAESRLRRVERLYLDLLGRFPDASGQRFWAGVILRTGNDVALAVNLASSQEYYNRAQGLVTG